MPASTWMNVHTANVETDKPHACAPEFTNCADDSCALEGDTNAASAEFNDPGPSAPAGAGYTVSAVAAGCGLVGHGSAPTVEEHGHVLVCSGCT